jgi:LPS-assembly protein
VIFFGDSGCGIATEFMLRLCSLLVFCLAFEWLAAAAPVLGQGSLAGCRAYKQQNMTVVGLPNNHWVLEGTADAPVRIDCDELQLSADHMESFQNEGRVTARGNVVYESDGNRIYAERMEFNTKTRLGTFYVASGTATLREKATPELAGGQEPDLMFKGEEIHKIGPKKYRIVGGNFTTCVQPTPRWEMQSRSITLNLDDYALLKNAVFRVKNVPLMYLPIFYYPIQEDDRATGFVMPIYGSTTARGQSLSNAFFWAINRSHDATVMHDWFSEAGQQIGGEYRYILGPGSQGSSTVSFLNEPPRTVPGSGGSEVAQDGQRTYTVVGGLSQRLPLNLRFRANANYYSSIRTQQAYQQNLDRATQSTRRMDANVSGSWSEYSLSATFERTDYFRGEKSFTRTGSLPRVTFTRGERPIGGAPIYFGVNSELVTIERSTTTAGLTSDDNGLSRFDLNPTLRIPFTRWPFLTVNSTVSWRGTYWTESCADRRPGSDETACPATRLAQVPEAIGRQFFDFQARFTGPVFNRIWNTPGGRYAEKYKHVVQPTFTIRRTTAIDNFDRIVRLDGTDFTVGGTQFTYGVSNRLYAKKETSREILTATVSQSYFSDRRGPQYDSQNQSGHGQTPASNFGVVGLQVRGAPTDQLQADFRTEWDPAAHSLRSLGFNGTASAGTWLQTSGGWSQIRYIPKFNSPSSATNYLNASVDLRRAGGRLGTSYAFNYDLRRDTFLQQRYTAYYNAQCCGIAIEYQTYNLSGGFSSLGILEDQRFNLSFTLAGIGTFSNLFGAFGGQQGR